MSIDLSRNVYLMSTYFAQTLPMSMDRMQMSTYPAIVVHMQGPQDAQHADPGLREDEFQANRYSDKKIYKAHDGSSSSSSSIERRGSLSQLML